MTRIAMAVMTVSLLAAHEPAGQVLLDQSFEVAANAEPDAPAIGDYALIAVEFSDRIEIAESFTLAYQGRKIAVASSVLCAVHADGLPTVTRGEATTSVNGAPVMKAAFRIDGRKLVSSTTVTATDEGAPLEAPRQREQTIDLPEGPVLPQSARAVIGPRLLAAPGEMKIVWVEFPDDVTAGAHVKNGFSLVRSAANGEGVYELTVKSEHQDLGPMPLDANGRIKPCRMFGKYFLREAKAGAA